MVRKRSPPSAVTMPLTSVQILVLDSTLSLLLTTWGSRRVAIDCDLLTPMSVTSRRIMMPMVESLMRSGVNSAPRVATALGDLSARLT